MKTSYFSICMFLMAAASALANVSVSSPSNGASVGSPVPYVATATTSTCSKGVASMGIYVDNQLVYVVNGARMNTTWPINAGKHNTVVEEWDYCGGATYTTLTLTVNSQTGVWVTSPTNNSRVGSPTKYVATASTTTCSKGVASMGIYVNNVLQYVVNGASLNTNLNLSAGTYNTVVEEWDHCGGAAYTPVTITVQGGNVLSKLQASSGWKSWGELPPNYAICSGPCPGVTWSMTQGIKSPAMSGSSTRFNIGGTTPYSDVLWSIPLIGQGSTQGLPDSGHTLLPTLHNFTYDAYFYPTNLGATQVLEFDISMYFNGLGLIWGNQCRVAGGNEWDIWDNVNSRWVPTGVTCNPVKNVWNHVTIQAQRESDNSLLFQSITLNGVTSNINQRYAPGTAPSGWWGITVNYQMDGNIKQTANTTYLDNFSFTYQ
jgi:Bacterial Ig domain